MFEDIHGLSCVENQILAILRSRGNDIFPLYYNCAMPLKEIFFFMVMRGNKQEYFDRVPRIQDELKKLNVISLMLEKEPNIDSVTDELKICKENEYILIRVTPVFTKDILFARGLRNDHFVSVRAEGTNFIVQNDIPQRTVEITSEQFAKAYDGEYFKLTVNRALTNDDIRMLWKSRKFKPERYTPFYFYEKDFYNISSLGIKLRNMTGVYKTLRYRLAEYYGMYVDTGFIHDALPEIDKYYATFEYYNLKRNTPYLKYFSLFNELNKTEISIMRELKNRLEETVNDRGKGEYGSSEALCNE